MEKRGVFILMQFFLALWLPSALQMPTCASSVKATFTVRSCIQLIKERKKKGLGTGVEKGNFISLAFPPSFVLQANQQEGSLPLAEGQVHRLPHSQGSAE